MQALDRHAAAQRGVEEEGPLGRRLHDHAHEVVGGVRVVLALGGIAVEPQRPVSSERSAFCRLSGNVRPIAITSPTDCIIVPSTGDAPGSFSNAQRGTLVTT